MGRRQYRGDDGIRHVLRAERLPVPALGGGMGRGSRKEQARERIGERFARPQRIRLGSQVAVQGSSQISNRVSIWQMTKGVTPRYISPKVISGGAMLRR
jgi:hypothetical protein